MEHKWLDWAQRIQAVSQAGLAFSKDKFDRERYEQLRDISAEILDEYSTIEFENAIDFYHAQEGYPTPKVDGRGVVFKEGKLLLVREEHDDCWALPGGFCEVGISPSENIIKEIEEESGFQTIPVKLLALLDYKKHPHPPQPFHYYKIFIECRIVGGDARNGLETKDVKFFPRDNLPALSTKRNTESQINMLFDYLENPYKAPVID
ncbi:NUDIX hydrolase [Sediminibacillus massiliensis]|uniref:NUDIX hydrolase n=1 Tax=Sediminibacillus massiliensis TaxID=1926277 RepID=UPI0009884E3B|nr:NUDIX hydrolase [Sediminibacillus massiliensis]